MTENQRRRKLAIWDDFCREHHVLERSAPLFAGSGGEVATLPRGNGGRPVLARSPEMEALVIWETRKVLDDYASGGPLRGARLHDVLAGGGARAAALRREVGEIRPRRRQHLGQH